MGINIDRYQCLYTYKPLSVYRYIDMTVHTCICTYTHIYTNTQLLDPHEND